MVCAQYSRPLSMRSHSQPPRGFNTPSSSSMAFRPPQSIGTGPLMNGRITKGQNKLIKLAKLLIFKGPVLPRSFRIHPAPPSSMFL